MVVRAVIVFTFIALGRDKTRERNAEWNGGMRNGIADPANEVKTRILEADSANWDKAWIPQADSQLKIKHEAAQNRLRNQHSSNNERDRNRKF